MSNSFQANDNSQPTGTQGTFSQSEQQPTTQAVAPTENGQSVNNDFALLQKRLDDSQAFIQQLKDEGKANRDAIAKLEQERSSAPAFDINEIVEQVNQSKGANAPDPAVNSDELVNQVFTKMNDQKREEAEQQNFNAVADTLRKRFGGDDVDKKVQELASSSGLSLDDVFKLAKSSPKAVYKLLGVEAESAPVTPSVGGINTAAFSKQVEAPSTTLAAASNDRERIAIYNKMLAQVAKNS